MRSVRALLIAVFLVVSVGACAREPDDSTPEGALSMFLDAIERSGQGDPRGLEDAFALIDEESQRRLSERARSATALGARELEPWEMLVSGRADLRFPPRRGSGLRVRPGATDETAIVVVAGAQPEQRAEIPMRREPASPGHRGGWRVVIAIPDVRTASGRSGVASEEPAPAP